MIARKINFKVVFLNREINVDNLVLRELDVKSTMMIDKNSMRI